MGNGLIKVKKKAKVRDTITSYLFIVPVLLGIALFTLIPMGSSLIYSFTEYRTVDTNPSYFVGLSHYITAFTDDWGNVGNALWRTFVYSFISIPLSLVLSFIVALLLVRDTKGIKIYRTLIYLPVLLPAVVSGLLWADSLDYYKGVVNMLLTTMGFERYGFYTMPDTALPTFIGTSLFGIGGGMILWIAQMKTIPDALTEAARIEGAGYFTRLFKIVIPMCTPMIFYNLVLNIIGALQVFTSAIMVATGGSGNSLSFMAVYIYNTLTQGWNMGYACALSWLLFLIIGILTVIVFSTSKWVYYGDGN